MPRVSVIIPTYNLSKILVERSIASILAQTYSDLECIVIDDGSTDDTQARVEEVAKLDGRVRYIKKTNGGQASARNAGMREARGEFIAFHDHDDEFLPEYVATALGVFEKFSNISYLSSWAMNRHMDGVEKIYKPELEPFWKLAVGNGWFFRADVFREKGLLFDETMSGFEDLDLHIQCHRAGLGGYIISEPLRRYYVNPPRLAGGGSYSSSNYGRQADHLKAFIQKNELTYSTEGSRALSWLYAFYSSLCLKADRMRDARGASIRALRVAYSFPALRDFLLSFLGFEVYRWLYNVKHT